GDQNRIVVPRRAGSHPRGVSLHVGTLSSVGDLRYADAGVDIDEGNRAVSLIRRAVNSTHTPQVLQGIGAYGGLYALDTSRHHDPVLVSSTDSVGTKVKIAIATGRHR